MKSAPQAHPNPPATPGPPVRRVPLWSAAVARLNANPPVMVPYKCPVAGSEGMGIAVRERMGK